MNKLGLALGMILMWLGGFLMGCSLWVHVGRRAERQDAAAAGVARWEADPKTGETQFVYGNPTTWHPVP